jgi:sulfur relay (sulfurtransferase) complex TusBCD TusD component (DsrE family)
VSVEQYKFEAMNTLLNLGKAIIKKGHQINGIFFYGSGVYNLKRNISIGKSMKNLPKELEEFCSINNIEIGGCSTWISYTGLQESDLIEGACQVGLPTANEWIKEADRLIVFGSGT